MSSVPLCIYHASCMDGFAAYTVARKWHEANGMKLEGLPHQYGQPFDPSVCKDRTVYLIDYSFKRPVMLEVLHASARLVVIDHHQTAEEELKDFPARIQDSVIFNMDESGALLAWRFFFPSTDVPKFIRHVSDRDLWKFEIPNTEEVMDFTASLQYSYDEYLRLIQMCGNAGDYSTLVHQGMAIGRYKKMQVEIACAQAREVELDGYKVLAVNFALTNLVSQVAGKLAESRPFGICYFQAREGYWVYSLRSREAGVDVSKIAAAHGGGGHAHAAGFRSETLLF